MNLKDKILGVAKELFIKMDIMPLLLEKLLNYQKVVKGIFIITLKQKENLFLEILNIEESKWQEQWKKEQIKCKTNREKILFI